MTANVQTHLLLNATEAAEYLGLGRRTFYTYDAAGHIPQAIRVGERRMWRRDELGRWVDAGCPPRREWADTEREGGVR